MSDPPAVRTYVVAWIGLVALLATTFGRDIAWQPLPASLASALASTLRITTGTPYVSNVLARTVDHDGTADASATVVRFSVQIEFVQ